MKPVSFAFLCFIALFGVSCQGDYSSGKTLEYPDLPYTPSKSIVLLDSIKIPIGFNVMKEFLSFSPFRSEEGDFITFLNKNDLKLYSYKIGQDQLEEELQLFVEGPNSIGKVNTLLHYQRINEDRFVVSNQQNQSLFEFDRKGILLHKWAGATESEKFHALCPAGFSQIVNFKNQYLIPFSPGDPAWHKQLKKNYGYITIDKSTGKPGKFFKLPQIYLDHYWSGNFPYYMPSGLVVNDKVFISFPIDPNIYIQGESLSSAYLPSKYMLKIKPYYDRIPKILFGQIEEDNSTYIEYLKTTNWYAGLYYLPESKIFVRGAWINKPTSSNEKFEAYSFSFIIFNEKFEKIGENVVSSNGPEGGIIGFNSAFSIGNKIYVPTTLGTEEELVVWVYGLKDVG